MLDLPGTGPLDPVRSAGAALLRPVRAVGDAIFEPVGNGWKGAFGYGEVRDENDELRRELEDLRGLEIENERLKQDNFDLRAEVGVEVPGEELATAQIVSGPLNSFEQTVQIDLGSDDGVQEGMAVVTGAGLLGRIAEVDGGSATVELLTAPTWGFGIRLRDGTVSLARGQGRGAPLLLELDNDIVVREGDPVFTSGIDRSAFPPDIAVGRVTEVRESVDGLDRTIEVEPAVDLRSRYVRVVLREAPR